MFTAARPKWAFVLVGIAASMPAFGQSRATPAQSDGLASPVELTYRSSFEKYQHFTDEKVGSWRDANDTVGRIGGWRAYAKEGQQAEPQGSSSPASTVTPSSPARAPAAAPAANPHEGHGKQ